MISCLPLCTSMALFLQEILPRPCRSYAEHSQSSLEDDIGKIHSQEVLLVGIDDK